MASNQDGNISEKSGRVEIQQGLPLRFLEDPKTALEGLVNPKERERSPEDRERSRLIASTLKAYREAFKTLLSGQYAELRDYAPTYLKEPCNTTAISCTNGIIVRYDLGKGGETKLRVAVTNSNLTELAPIFSDFVVHFPPNSEPYDPGPHVPKLELAKVNFVSGASQPIASFSPIILAPLTSLDLGALPPPPKRPCLLSLTNEIQLVMEGSVVPADATTPSAVDRSHDFLARGKMKLAVGWEAIEMYAPFDPNYWKPEYAALWAERDLLAAVVRKNLEDTQFAAIDPNVAARKKFKNLLDQLQALLEGPEEPAHQFLKAHPELLCPVHTKCWSKRRLGDRVTDFVFRKPANDYLLVELESPLRELFRKDGQQREELTHAVNQILDWRTYIEDNLATVQETLELTGISSNPSSTIVIGRSSALSEENRRKLVALQNQNPKLQILTYDDLIQTSKAWAENLFGSLDTFEGNVEVYFAPSTSRNS